MGGSVLGRSRRVLLSYIKSYTKTREDHQSGCSFVVVVVVNNLSP